MKPFDIELLIQRIREIKNFKPKGANSFIINETKSSKSLFISSAIYEYDAPYIRTKNFAEHYSFESLKAYLGDETSYGYVFHKLYELKPLFAKEYLRLIFCDVVVNNVDRHNENIGFLRDERSGRIVSLSPNFDNNLA